MKYDDTHPGPAAVPDDGARAVCGTCGSPLDLGEWHPSVGHTDADGVYHLVRLCSSSCRATWRRHNEVADTT